MAEALKLKLVGAREVFNLAILGGIRLTSWNSNLIYFV